MNPFYIISLLFLHTVFLYGQKDNNPFFEKITNKNNFKPEDASITINQDPKIEKLLLIKNQMDKDGAFSERYRIQLLSGTLKEVNEVKDKADDTYEEWDTEIIYETPNYKILLGNFRNKLEAERAFLEIKTEFPEAFIFIPKRKN